MIKFNLHNIANTETGAKARVHYSMDNRLDGRKCVTIYGKDYTRELHKVLPKDASNDSDSMTDYFANSKAVLFEGHPLYAAARAAAERFESKRAAKYAA